MLNLSRRIRCKLSPENFSDKIVWLVGAFLNMENGLRKFSLSLSLNFSMFDKEVIFSKFEIAVSA